MCEQGCEHPEKSIAAPDKCGPEQIKECHGDVKAHPCEEKKK